MRTLYIRNVPDDVAEALEVIASREGLSVNALAVRELRDAARRGRNAGILAGLPDLGITPQEVAETIRAERRSRDRR